MAIAHCRGSCWWDVGHAGWVVTLDSPERQEFYGRTLEEALASCLVWLIAPELGVGAQATYEAYACMNLDDGSDGIAYECLDCGCHS